MTLSEVYGKALTKLQSAQIPEAANDVKLLMLEYLDIDRGDFFAHPEKEIPAEKEAFLEKMLDRRAAREPLQYITGHTGFMGLDFAVTPDVLIPRADTEILTEEALGELHDGFRVLDLCTGSGCILISLLSYSNDCEGIGADISEAALKVAEKNAAELIQGKNYRFVCGDLFEAVEGRFDIIVSNPPYIASAVCETLMPEVKDHEPRLALDGTEDGLYFYRKIAGEAGNYLEGSGHLILEIGYDQGEAVKKLLLDNGFTDVRIIKDYAGLDRVVRGTKPV